MKARVWEHCKNALIVLLLCCIIILTLMALPPTVVRSLRLPPEALRLLGVPAGAEPVPARNAQAAAAQPLLISVRTETGRSTAQRDFSRLDAMRDRLTPFLGEGLRTAGAAAKTERSEFYETMSREGAYFDYGAAMPVSAVCAWLGAENAALTGSARHFLLTVHGGAVELYLLGDDCLRCTTGVSARELLEALAAYTPDGSAFAAEEDPGVSFDPLMLRETAVTLPNAVAEIPAEDVFAESAATLLNFNPYGSGTYSDADGNRVFTENSRTLTVSPDGTVVFTDSAEAATGPVAAADTVSARIETVRSLAASIGALVPNDARLYLCGCEQTGGRTLCRFRYVLDGVPIVPDALTAVFTGSALTELRFSVRTCYTGVSRIPLLPLPQAAAIAEPGAYLTAAYHDSARGTLSAGWIQS